MLALDGARLRRSLAMTKQDCSDRYQLPPPSSRSQYTRTAGQDLARRRKLSLNPLAAFGISATTPSIILSVLATNGSRASPSFGSSTHRPLSFVRENYI